MIRNPFDLHGKCFYAGNGLNNSGGNIFDIEYGGLFNMQLYHGFDFTGFYDKIIGLFGAKTGAFGHFVHRDARFIDQFF